MYIIVKYTNYLDNIEAHLQNMQVQGAIVPGSAVALEGIAQLSTVQVMVTQVIMASPDALFDTVHLHNTQQLQTL